MGTITEDNFLVWNQGKNPLVNFNFMLRVELLYDLPCKSVKAFTREMEYEFIQEGGVNDYVHMRRKPITRPFTLEVERYVGVDYLDPMPLGADLALPVLLFVGRAPNQFIPFVVARTYVFTGCTVMKKVYGELVGDRSGLLVETTTLGDKTTVVRAVLRNGFEIVESSACVSAENYDEAMGREICLEKIKDKVWMLLGFLLQTAVHGI